MATSFGTEIAINWLCLNGRPTECIIADTLRISNVAMATIFWLSVGYNFGCMRASDTLFDARGRFLGSSYPMKT